MVYTQLSIIQEKQLYRRTRLMPVNTGWEARGRVREGVRKNESRKSKNETMVTAKRPFQSNAEIFMARQYEGVLAAIR